jgi:cytochrome P450
MDALMSTPKAARENPSDDLLSAIVSLEFERQVMDDQHLRSVLSNLVRRWSRYDEKTTARGLHCLSGEQSLRPRVIADPRLIDATCEETLRCIPCAQVMTCTVSQDISIGDEQLRRGEPAVVCISGANRDPKIFPNPDTFDVDRTSNRHMPFGLGVHRCLGAHVARQLFPVMVAEILNRIPDHVVDEASMVEYSANPYRLGVRTMPATFTPPPSSTSPDRGSEQRVGPNEVSSFGTVHR